MATNAYSFLRFSPPNQQEMTRLFSSIICSSDILLEPDNTSQVHHLNSGSLYGPRTISSVRLELEFHNYHPRFIPVPEVSQLLTRAQFDFAGENYLYGKGNKDFPSKLVMLFPSGEKAINLPTGTHKVYCELDNLFVVRGASYSPIGATLSIGDIGGLKLRRLAIVVYGVQHLEEIVVVAGPPISSSCCSLL